MVLYVNNNRLFKSKFIKETLFPKWDDLSWVWYVAVTLSLM